MPNSYQPAAQVLDRLKQVAFVAVIGPTAVGKSTLITAALEQEPQLHLVLNNTTRAPRPGERPGVDYLFQTREHMEARIAKGEYVQVAPSVLGELYATAPEGYPTEGVGIMAVLGEAMPVFRALPFKRLDAVFIVPPSWEIWQERINAHGFTPEQLAKRMDEAKRSLQFALDNPELKFVVSGALSTAAKDFITIVLGRPFPARLQQDQARARVIVRNLLAKL